MPMKSDAEIAQLREQANTEMRNRRAHHIDRAMQLSITCEMLDAKGNPGQVLQEVMRARGELARHLQMHWPSAHLQNRTLQRDVLRALEKLVVQYPDVAAQVGMDKTMLSNFRTDLEQ